MWLALSPATATTGCMRMIPGSHLNGRIDHEVTDYEDNVLFLGQTVSGIDEADAVMCPLEPGEASFHHGWTLHASMPNAGDDRRIGVNVQYLGAHVRRLKDEHDTAMLVRGTDRFGYFGADYPAETDLDPAAIARQVELENRYKSIAGSTGA